METNIASISVIRVHFWYDFARPLLEEEAWVLFENRPALDFCYYLFIAAYKIYIF